jgi:hypothetical protein
VPVVKFSALRVVLAWICLAVPLARVDAQAVDSSVYVRTDTDHTTVVAPRAHARTPISEGTHVDFTYAADIWTSASIDIRASASQAITEQRDEIDVGLDHEFSDVTLTGGYRFSTEPDYTSHGGNLGLSYDFAGNNATLALGASANFDRVGRAGDRLFSRPVRNLSGRIAFTQVLDTNSLVQGIYEIMHAQGYNSSPYRYIGIGGTDGLCWYGKTSTCAPESSPDLRLKHALAIGVRRSFSSRWSAGAGYRLYLDSWSLLSHTALADLAFTPTTNLILSLRYRFYTQNAVSFYRALYPNLDAVQRFYTNDKELSPLTEHRLALDIERSVLISASGQLVRPMLSIAGSLYNFSNFIPLKSIQALEITLGVAFEL